MRLLLVLGLGWLSGVLSLSASQIGVADWQKTLLGIPLTNSPLTTPTFHRVNAGVRGTRSVLLMTTESNVIGAIDAPSGAVVWRHINEPNDPILAYQPNQDGLVCVSGPGGANVRLLEALTGHIVWETRLHDPKSAYLLQPGNLGINTAFARDKSADVFVLSNGHTLNRLNGLTGERKWTWTSQDQASAVMYSKMVTTSSTVYIIGLTKSFASYTLHVTSLDASSGSVISSQPIPSSIKDAMDTVFTLTSGVSPHPRLVWHEGGATIKSVSLPPDLNIKSPILTKGYENIISIQLESFGLFVALKDDGAAVVLRLDGTGQGLRKTWEFADSARSTSYTESIFGGGLDKAGLPYITRINWSHVLQACSMQIFAPHGAEGQGMITGFTFPFDTSKYGVLLHTAVDIANPSEYLYIGRVALTTSTGTFQLWQQDKVQWSREESLAALKAAEFVDLPERVVVGSAHRGDEGVLSRLERQSKDMKNLPSFIIRFLRRFLTGSYTSMSSSSSSTDIYRDTFGFKKMIVVATSTGKVIALDSATGREVWARLLSISDIFGKTIDGDMRMVTIKSVAEGDGTGAEVVLVVKNGTTLESGDDVKTLVYHFDALTGKTVGKDKTRGIASPQYEFQGDFEDVLLLHGGDGRSVSIVDKFANVHVYPLSSLSSFVENVHKLHFPLVTGEPNHRRLSGRRIISTAISDSPNLNVFPTYSTWSTAFVAQQSVHSVIKPSNKLGPVASYGKVLGNRDTLYKYINSHLIAVVATPFAPLPSLPQECGVYLIDSVKGNVIYHAPLYMTDAGRRCGEEVVVSLNENWLVFGYYEDDVRNGKAKGWRMVTVELYEGDKPNDKSSSSDLSSYSYDKTKVKVFQQSFVFPHGMTAITTTATKFGITLKDIIVATDKHQIQAVPRKLLDPRRPKQKPTAEEQEEGLVPFDPILIEDPKRTLSHGHSIAHVKSILTTPSQLESTSIIFAHGLDLFQTRVSPSSTFDLLSEDFNRLQLVLTICGLVVSIAITRPLVKAKALKGKWYPYSS